MILGIHISMNQSHTIVFLFQLIQRIIQCINMSGYSYYYEKLFVSGRFVNFHVKSNIILLKPKPTRKQTRQIFTVYKRGQGGKLRTAKGHLYLVVREGLEHWTSRSQFWSSHHLIILPLTITCNSCFIIQHLSYFFFQLMSVQSPCVHGYSLTSHVAVK